MTAQALLETIKLHGIELKSENGKLYARPSLPENLKAEVKARKGEIVALLSTPPDVVALSQAYRHYWELPESEPIERFQALHREIDLIEKQVGVEVAWRVLEEAARGWHQEKGLCPFCGKDELHLETERA